MVNTARRVIKLKSCDHERLLTVFLSIVAGVAIGYLSGIKPILGLVLTIAGLGLIALAYIFFRDGKLSLDRLVVPLLIVAVLFPSIRLPAEIPAARLELVIIIIAWALFLLGQLSTGKGIKLRWNPTNKWFFLFGACILASMAYAAFVHGYYPIARDFWEFGKLVEYFLIFALVASLNIPPKHMRKYYIISLVIFLCAAAFGFAQYFNLFNINSWLSPYYYNMAKYGTLTDRWFLGTAGNPNDFGALMVLAASLALAGAVWLKGKGIKLSSWLSFGVFSLAIVFTLSRSALLSLLVVTTFILLLRYPMRFGFGRAIRMLLLVVPLLFAGSLIALQFAPEGFFMRIGYALNLATDTSWQARLVAWENHLDMWKQSPLFGWGPGKATMTITVDNEWLLLLRRYGAIGVLVFILWFAGIYRTLSRIGRETKNNYTETFCTALQATLIAYAIYMIPAGVYHSLQLMPVLLILLGLAYTQRQSLQAVQQT